MKIRSTWEAALAKAGWARTQSDAEARKVMEDALEATKNAPGMSKEGIEAAAKALAFVQQLDSHVGQEVSRAAEFFAQGLDVQLKLEVNRVDLLQAFADHFAREVKLLRVADFDHLTLQLLWMLDPNAYKVIDMERALELFVQSGKDEKKERKREFEEKMKLWTAKKRSSIINALPFAEMRPQQEPRLEEETSNVERYKEELGKVFAVLQVYKVIDE